MMSLLLYAWLLSGIGLIYILFLSQNESEFPLRCVFTVLIIVICFQYLYYAISIGQLKLQPHKSISDTITNTTDVLLRCARTKIPHYEKSWEKINQCIYNTQLYSVSKSRIPLINTLPQAFVIPRLFPNDVFIMRDTYNQESTLKKSLIIIHECTHLALSTVDHAYIWQESFYSLSKEKHQENADSYVNLIINHCINDISFFLYNALPHVFLLDDLANLSVVCTAVQRVVTWVSYDVGQRVVT